MNDTAVLEILKQAAQAQRAGKLEEAEALYRQALVLKPDYAPAQFGLGTMLSGQGRLEEAVTCLQNLLKDKPDVAEVHLALGNVYDRLSRLNEARTHLEKAVALKPELASAHCSLGSVLGRQNQLVESIEHFRTAADLQPNYAEAWYQLGYALSLRGELDEAVACCRKAIALRPGYAEAHNSLGFALFRQGKAEEAIEAYRQALVHKPGYGKAAFNLGLALSGLGRWAEAREALETAVAQQPDFADAQVELGLVYCRVGRRAEALECFHRAVALQPEHVLAHYNIATTLLQESRWSEAEESFRRVLEFKPEFAEACSNLGIVVSRQGRRAEAIELFRKAVELKPDYANGINNLGKELLDQGRPAEALPLFRKVIELAAAKAGEREQTPSSGELLDLEMRACSTEIFISLYLSSTTLEQFMSACQRYARRVESPLKPLWPRHANVRDPERRLKVGYLSPDFRGHSVAFFMEPILAHHDKGAVEVYCYYSNMLQDAVTERLQRYADRWIPCGALTDEQLAERIRSDGIDILVDLAGHTAGNRLLTFARKPAPVQVSYLGYPATTGLSAMDYRLVTWDTDPAGAERWHTERLYRLPRSLWCYRPAPDLPAVAPRTPARHTGFVTFGSLNNIAKVSEATVAAWSELLQRVPGSQLVMTNVPEGEACALIAQRFAARGIGADRVQLRGKLSQTDYEAQLNAIDIALDPFPYTGTTTTCDVLWRGIPVVTLIGETSVARSGYALLKMIGLSELAAPDTAGYLDTAAALARDLDRLEMLRQGLRARMEASPLRDEAGMTRDLEAAYRALWQAWCAAPAREAAYQQALGQLQAGRPEEAAALFREILAQQPEHFPCLHMLGVAEQHAGRPEEALRCLDEAVRINAEDAGAHYNRGLVLQALKQPGEAVASFDRALALKADFFEAWNNRGLALRDLGSLEEAAASYRRALEIKPEGINALNNLGNIHYDLGRYDEALSCFDHAMQLQPGDAQTHYNRGVVLDGLKRTDEAAASYRRALEYNPDHVEALNNLGTIYHEQRDYERALSCYERAIALGPARAEFHICLGNILYETGRVDEALLHYLRAQTLDETNAKAHWNEGLCRLTLGELKAGFEKFEWRWKKAEYALARASFPKPPWLGQEEIAGKTILLWAEQGLGDALQFCRYVPMVAARGGRVLLGAQPALMRLLARLPGPERVLGAGEALTGYDLHCPLMSLPLVFGTTLETIPAAVPYLFAAEAKVAEWKQRLGPARGRRVGLAWSGNPEHKNDRLRSIALAAFAPLKDAGVELVSVQKEVRESDRAALAALGVRHYGEALADFEDTAALIAGLDLVIAVDTAVAHLAGALGKPVWILLPYSPDWRWLLQREDSPWYPTARLFRQPAIGDWTAVLQRVAAELQP